MPSEKTMRTWERGQDPITILVVDDEPEYLDLIRLFLEDEQNFLVDTCSSAREALIDLKTQKYDIIISDYTMPWMDGIIFLKSLRAQGDHTPFILISTKGREDMAIEALNAGAEFYLVKDGRAGQFFSTLVGKINEIMRRRVSKESDEMIAFIESFPVGLVRISPKGELLVWNRAFSAMLGLGREERVAHRGLFEFFADEKDRILLSDRIGRAGRIDEVVIPLVTRKQENVWVRMRGMGNHDAHGKLLYLDVVVEEQSRPSYDTKNPAGSIVRTLEKSG
jgi:DNA-binding response OmpR family regulator